MRRDGCVRRGGLEDGAIFILTRNTSDRLRIRHASCKEYTLEGISTLLIFSEWDIEQRVSVAAGLQFQVLCTGIVQRSTLPRSVFCSCHR